ncbi:hypothetical protein C2E23DRAFT_849937 [Lenzites betulinus]|nr:hypothetical protein C2E23DRAFT_849937 [Lenzites betulinus]
MPPPPRLLYLSTTGARSRFPVIRRFTPAPSTSRLNTTSCATIPIPTRSAFSGSPPRTTSPISSPRPSPAPNSPSSVVISASRDSMRGGVSLSRSLSRSLFVVFFVRFSVSLSSAFPSSLHSLPLHIPLFIFSFVHTPLHSSAVLASRRSVSVRCAARLRGPSRGLSARIYTTQLSLDRTSVGSAIPLRYAPPIPSSLTIETS